MTTAQHRSEADAIVEVALASAAPRPIGTSGNLWAVNSGDTTDVVDVRDHDAKYLTRPLRKRGTSTVFDAESFVLHLTKHQVPGETEVWADLEARTVTAVYNAHAATEAGFADHRLTLHVRETVAWKAWAQLNGRNLEQTVFAEHLEQRAQDVVEPDGATLLEIAQTFQANRSLAFESGRRLSDGNVKLQYAEDTVATAGSRGELSIPDHFTLGISPFEGSPRYRLTANLRWRIVSSALTLGYVLIDPEKVIEDAFTEIVNTIGTAIDGQILFGRPGPA